MDIVKYVEAIVVSLGGFTAIVVVLIQFGGNKIADLLSRKYEAKLDKQLSDYKHLQKIDLQRRKSLNEECVYVSKNRFDKEFNFIEEYLSRYYEFTYLMWAVYLSMEKDSFYSEYEQMKNKSDELVKFFFKHRVILNAELSEMYEEAVRQVDSFCNIAQKAREQFEKCLKVGIVDEDGRILAAYQSGCQEAYRELSEIHEEVNVGEKYGYNHMVDVSRSYLNSLQAF